ncbi:hypothetical protein OIO90_002292 [Microbotryomycetes sp. JL221]|nr:hypothetical protein OIO90_002292 [Microbotryomycetes sp. JL221]
MLSLTSHEDEQFASPTFDFKLDNHNTATPTTAARTGTLTFARRPTPPTASSTRDDDGLQGQTRELKTPNLISYTRKGAVPHLTRDNVARLPNEMVHVSLEHMIMDQSINVAFTHAPFSLHRYLGFNASTSSPKSQLVCLSLRDETDEINLPPNSDHHAVACTLRGAVRVSPQSFLNATLPRPPDLLFAFGEDATTETMTTKRADKCIRRSLNWVEQIAIGAKDRTNVFAPLVGGDSLQARSEYSKALTGIASSRASANIVRDPNEPTIDDHIKGYVVTCPTHVNDRTTLCQLLNASFKPLSNLKPRVAQLVKGPHDILTLVRHVGIDLFVEEWSNTCATLGVALDFNFPVNKNHNRDTSTSSSSRPDMVTTSNKFDIGHCLFDQRYQTSFIPLSQSNLLNNNSLNEQSDSKTLVPSTRAYLHHLFNAHEMTGSIILTLHNNLIMSNFIKMIQYLIQKNDGSFEFECDEFFKYYDQGLTTMKGGSRVYQCVERAKKAWQLVEQERGKGSLKDKRGDNLEQSSSPTSSNSTTVNSLSNDIAATGLDNLLPNKTGTSTPDLEREQMAVSENKLRNPLQNKSV